MQMPGPRDILNLLARPPGIFCCAKALGLGAHFGAKAPGCPGGMVTGQIDTCITIAFALSHHSRTVGNSDIVLEKMGHCVPISRRKEGSFNRSVFSAHCPGPLSVKSLISTWTTLWSFHGVSIKLCRRTFQIHCQLCKPCQF